MRRESGSPADDDVIGQIYFTGKDDGGNNTDYASIKVIAEDVTNGTEDGRLSFNILDGGSAVEVMSIFDNFVGIGTIAPEQLLHVHANDSGSSYSADGADRFILENNDSLRIDIRTPASATAGIMFSDTTRNAGSINFSHSTDNMTLQTGGGTSLTLIGAGQLSTKGESAPDVSAGGLCIQQGANDTNAFSLKSSDVAHGVTDLEETDTFFSLRKFGANDGGVQMRSMAGASSNCGLFIDTVAGSQDTGKGTGDHGCTNIDAQKDNGVDKQGLDSNGNLLTVSNDNHVRFILDAEGDIHVDGSSSISTYDTYEDAHLVRAYDLTYGQTSKGLINSKFDKFINYNHDSLVEAGIIGVPNKKENEDGTEAYGLLNSTAMQRLHNGAIWQQYEKTEKLTMAMYELAKETIGEEKAKKILEKHEVKLLS